MTAGAPTGLGLDPARRAVLLWACLLIAVNQLGFGAIVPVVPLYAQAFGVSGFAIGLAIAIYGLARFVANVPAGRLADARGRRVALAAGGLVTVLGNVLNAAAPSYEVFLGARFISGLGAAMVLIGGQLVVNDIATPANRGRLMAIYQGTFGFAVGIGPIPGGFLAEHLGLRWPFAAYAGLALVVTLIAWFGMPETRPARASVPTGASAQAATPSPLTTPAARLSFLLICTVSFTAFFARTGALFNVVPLLAAAHMGLSTDEIGLGLGANSVVGVLLAYPSGWLTDRFGRKAVIVPSTLVSGASLLLYAVAGNLAGYLLASVVWGIASGIASSAPVAYAADLAPTGGAGWLLSRYRTVADAGYVAGPLILGLLASVASPVVALVFCAAMLVVASTLFALRAPETLPSRARSTSPIRGPS